MTVKYFCYSNPSERELNFVGKKWNFRIGTHQIALWRDYEPVFSYRRDLRVVD